MEGFHPDLRALTVAAIETTAQGAFAVLRNRFRNTPKLDISTNFSDETSIFEGVAVKKGEKSKNNFRFSKGVFGKSKNALHICHHQKRLILTLSPLHGNSSLQSTRVS